MYLQFPKLYVVSSILIARSNHFMRFAGLCNQQGAPRPKKTEPKKGNARDKSSLSEIFGGSAMQGFIGFHSPCGLLITSDGYDA